MIQYFHFGASPRGNGGIAQTRQRPHVHCGSAGNSPGAETTYVATDGRTAG